MWSGLIENLKDARLVAKIQELFGIRIQYSGTLQNARYEERYDKNVCARSNFKYESNRPALRGEAQNANGYSMDTRYLDHFESDAPISDRIEKKAQPIKTPEYTITNYFWYYLFLFGTELGDEIFYSAFIPFWFWNIDGAVGRKVVLVWATVMTIGQALKDILCWPRPACPPAVRLQTKWSQEYGMPSTHAMVGISIPFSIVLFTMDKYIYPLPIGCAIATCWCMLVCTSRLYLGMHTVLDIIAGLTLAVALMIPLIPLVEITDYYILSNVWALTALITISLAVIVYYPCGNRWTPTRGDTTMVVSVTAGVHAGAWYNYNAGKMSAPSLPPPYNIVWPTRAMLGHMTLRTVLGFCSIIATKILCKSLSYTVMCAILKVNSRELANSKDDIKNRDKILVDLVYKYITCFMIGINTVYLLPKVFTMAGIERSSFDTDL